VTQGGAEKNHIHMYIFASSERERGWRGDTASEGEEGSVGGYAGAGRGNTPVASAQTVPISGWMYIRGLSECMYFVQLIPMHP